MVGVSCLVVHYSGLQVNDPQFQVPCPRFQVPCPRFQVHCPQFEVHLVLSLMIQFQVNYMCFMFIGPMFHVN